MTLSTAFRPLLDSRAFTREQAESLIRLLEAVAGDGQYTPEASALSNASVVTPGIAQYSRVGAIVTVSGRATVTTTAGGAATVRFDLSPPIPMDTTVDNPVHGTLLAAGAAYSPGVVSSAPGDGNPALRFQSAAIESLMLIYHYSYRALQ